VALFFRAPHSYTGEDVVELSCHGGSAVARRLVEWRILIKRLKIR
jgi:tRNA modification GTPase